MRFALNSIYWLKFRNKVCKVIEGKKLMNNVCFLSSLDFILTHIYDEDDILRTLKIYSTFSLRIYHVYDWIRHIIQTFVILMRREILVGKQIVSKINTSCMWNRKVKAGTDNLIFIKINNSKIIIITGRITNCIVFFKCILCYSVILDQMDKCWFWKHEKDLIIIAINIRITKLWKYYYS